MRLSFVALVWALLVAAPSLAHADVPNSEPGGCKCSMPGAAQEDALTAGVLSGGALLVIAARRRRDRG